MISFRDRRRAYLEGIEAAATLHRQLATQSRVSGFVGPIDVFSTIIDHNIDLFFKKLTDAQGYFLRASQPGILVTTERQLAVQRFTAAHELGHFILGHGRSLDEFVGETSPLDRHWGDQYGNSDIYPEVAAEAFAAEFLAPEWLVIEHLKKQNWRRRDIARPETVYQLSLRLGLSYTATCLVLRNRDAVSQVDLRRLRKHQPKELKRALLPAIEFPSRRTNVWRLTENDDGTQFIADIDDLFILELSESAGAGNRWALEPFLDADFLVLDDTSRIDDGDEVGGEVTRRMVLKPDINQAVPVTVIEHRPWEPPSTADRCLSIRFDILGRQEGMAEHKVRELLRAA